MLPVRPWIGFAIALAVPFGLCLFPVLVSPKPRAFAATHCHVAEGSAI